jgi:hypothetical protein
LKLTTGFLQTGCDEYIGGIFIEFVMDRAPKILRSFELNEGPAKGALI